MALDYAPVGPFEDEDEVQRGGYAYPPAIPPPADSPISAGPPAVGSTADLESRGLASHIAPPAGPGSTEDLESRGLDAHTAPPVAPAAARPTMSQFAPPELHGIRAFGARLAGPKFAQQREDLAEQRYKAALGDYEAPQKEEATEAETEQKTAQAEEQRAQAKRLAIPPTPKTPQEVYAQAVQEAVAAGRDPGTDPKVQQLADTITSIQRQPNAPAQKAVTLKLPSGQQAPGKVDHEGNLLTEDGKPAPQGTMLYQQPNYAQAMGPTKTVTMIGPNGLPTVMGFNPQTQDYDRPMGTSATGAYGHEMAQAGAVERGGEDLIGDLQQPDNREILGKLSSYISQGTLGTPVADQKAAYLSAKLKTFAALQPAMHGFRARSAQEAFENIVGGLAQDPDATISAIRGILSTAGAVNPGLNKPAAGGGFAAWKAKQK